MKKGAIASKIIVGAPAPISRDDLMALAEPGRHTGTVQRIRASHHKMARLCAAGLTNAEIAGLTGYTRERVSSLLGSPAMRELVAVYMGHEAEAERESLDPVLEIMASNLLRAQRHIADHFAQADEADELVPLRTALAVAADAADRTGYSKHTSQTNVNYNFGEALEKAIARSGKGSHMIDATAVRQPTLPRPVPPITTVNSRVEAPPRPLIQRRA